MQRFRTEILKKIVQNIRNSIRSPFFPGQIIDVQKQDESELCSAQANYAITCGKLAYTEAFYFTGWIDLLGNFLFFISQQLNGAWKSQLETKIKEIKSENVKKKDI